MVTEARKRAIKKYNQTKKGKLSSSRRCKKYESSERGKEIRKQINDRYRKTEKGIVNSKKQIKLHNQRLRQEIIDHYGGKCECCGEDNFEFLTIDHINGGGNKHKKELGIGSSINFYRWIKKNNYPDDLRILCWNCNCARGVYGYYPHQEEGENF